jgi:hypothetical protein
MPGAVADLLNGPAGAVPQEQLQWLKGVHQTFVSAPGSMAQVAGPLQEAIELLEKPEPPADLEARLAQLVLQAQGLVLYAVLEELDGVRRALAEELVKLPPGSADRELAERLKGAYEKAIVGLAKAYHGAREGHVEELKAVVPVLEEVRKIAQELGAS